VIVGGGVGIASTPLIAHALKDAGNRVIGILGARSAPLLILEDEMAEICDRLLIATDDGTKGHHGFAADLLKQVIDEEKIDAVWILDRPS
jgi:ferredoxin--NADP+ reductase